MNNTFKLEQNKENRYSSFKYLISSKFKFTSTKKIVNLIFRLFASSRNLSGNLLLNFQFF